jgi:integrase/recombinase XerD
MTPPLTLRLEEYLAMRRSFGHDLSTSERVLRRFAEFAALEGVDHVSVDLFLRWKERFGCADNNTWAARLGMVRGFAGWLQGVDPRTEVPPPGLVSGKIRRARPYIYSEGQIAEIVKAAARLPSAYGLRGWTYSTFFGLIAVSGLRIGEAIKLDEEDVDLKEGVLLIKRGKNGKSRMTPISAGAAERLRAYRAERNRILGASPAPFFLLDNGLRPTDCAARYNFAHVCQGIGLRAQEPFHKHGRGPRIHDLRHTFAVRTILGWYRRGLDPEREMFHLSTYLGHSAPEHTYWYIEAVPELLQLACQRAERSLAEGGAR